jgi:hypothetical protein
MSTFSEKQRCIHNQIRHQPLALNDNFPTRRVFPSPSPKPLTAQNNKKGELKI